MAEALAPLRARMPHVVRELEILRFAADFSSDADQAQIAEARRQVLVWAQNRSGGRLPQEAWDGASFLYPAGGRTTLATRLSANSAEIWALRADDPDDTVAGRIWTNEITIGRIGDEKPRLSIRQLASTAEYQLDIEPHVPGFVQQLAQNCGIQVDGILLRSDTWRIESDEDSDRLIDLLASPDRRRPVFVATGDERSANPDQPLIDAALLTRATIGLAHVAVVPAKFTFALSSAFGKFRSVYHGGVRAYLPGFDADANPHEHRLFLADSLITKEGAERCVRTLREFAAKESLLRFRLDHDVLTFGTVRNAALKAERERRVTESASDTDLLQAAQAQIQALEDDLKKAKDWEAQLTSLHAEEETRAITAEAQLRGSVARIQQLHEQLRASGEKPDSSLSLPDTWAEMADWCDENLVGRVALAPSARRSLKKPEFNDVQMAARCLIWLANECRDRRINGGGSLADYQIMDGVRNSSCGSDAYEFEFQGQRLLADWHVKSGGNTRDPVRCLRIYYGWDAQSQQIVVSDLPSHRRTGAS